MFPWKFQEGCYETILPHEKLDHLRTHEFSMSQFYSLDALFRRKRGRPPKNRIIEVSYNCIFQLMPFFSSKTLFFLTFYLLLILLLSLYILPLPHHLFSFLAIFQVWNDNVSKFRFLAIESVLVSFWWIPEASSVAQTYSTKMHDPFNFFLTFWVSLDLLKTKKFVSVAECRFRKWFSTSNIY